MLNDNVRCLKSTKSQPKSKRAADLRENGGLDKVGSRDFQPNPTKIICFPKVLVRGKVAVVCQHSHVEPGSQAHLEHKRKLLQLLELHDLHDSVQLVWLDIVGEEVDKLDHESSRKHEVQHCLVCKHCINARQTVHKKNYVLPIKRMKAAAVLLNQFSLSRVH